MDANNKNDSHGDFCPYLADYLAPDQPDRIIIIGGGADRLFKLHTDTRFALTHHFQTLDHCEARLSLPSVADSDVPEIQVTLLHADETGAALEQLLGRAVRLFPQRLITYTDSLSLPDAAFYAFGFRKLTMASSDLSAVSLRWFEYQLRDYKRPPAWLNARYWANPERFDLDEVSGVYNEEDDTDEEE